MALQIYDDNYFMKQALQEAQIALQEGEIPIGAVVVCNEKIIARGHNTTEMLQDATAHAEIIAITSAEENLHSKYLKDCTIYVTIEPCLMCAGAIMWSQIDKIVFGATDEKRGFFSNYNTFRQNSAPSLSKIKIVKGVLENECKELMQEFFKDKRK